MLGVAGVQVNEAETSSARRRTAVDEKSPFHSLTTEIFWLLPTQSSIDRHTRHDDEMVHPNLALLDHYHP
jgi:hypothetical protein